MERKRFEHILEAHGQWLASGGRTGTQANLFQADLRGMDLEGIDLRGAYCREAIFYLANLAYANFYAADCYGADFRRGSLCESNFDQTNLRQAKLFMTDLSGTNFGGTQVLQIGPVGEVRDYLVVIRHPNGDTEAQTEFFPGGTWEALEAEVQRRHARHPRYWLEFMAAIGYARMVFSVTNAGFCEGGSRWEISRERASTEGSIAWKNID